MANEFVLAFEALFFIVSIIGSAVAIYELRRSRQILSDVLFKKVITWLMYSSFLLAILAAVIALNFFISFAPDLADIQDSTVYLIVLFVLVWLAIASNIIIAMHIKEIGKTFGFGHTEEKELMIETLFQGKKK